MSAPAAALVELRGVTKVYREGASERAVLSSLNLSLGAGEFVVLLGRSGSGKSTLLNLVSGIDLASSGEVLVGGQDVGRMSEQDRTLLRRERMGFIFQTFNLLPTLTVEENVRLPLELLRWPPGKARARVAELLERVGLADRGGSFPDRLSGGEQQRIAVARALSHAPPLLLADEPTGNLDDATGLQVLELFQGLIRDAGTCALVVTHDVEMGKRADRVLSLESGSLVTR